jgi:two-component system sensor histidine kinase/response regulator
VLLAEDNKVNQLLARTILEKAGVQVTLADNGLKAVSAAVESAVPFDAILMDLQMPEMDGYEATRTILARLGAASPPIIAMTAHAMSEERDHCLAAGMVAHVAKPIDVRALYALLRQVMQPPTALG